MTMSVSKDVESRNPILVEVKLFTIPWENSLAYQLKLNIHMLYDSAIPQGHQVVCSMIVMTVLFVIALI